MKIKTPSFNLAVYMKGNKNADKLALVLPGKLDTKDYYHMQSLVNYLARRGYLSLSFDPPGTWESDGDISLYSMTNYLKAINELIKYFDNRSTFVVGHSRGGSMAMLAGITNPNVTHFTSIMSWFSFDPNVKNLEPNIEWEETGFKENKRDLPNNPKEHRIFKLPYSFQEDQEKYDMLGGLKKSHKPKLFIAGSLDKTVAPEVVKTAYQSSREPKMIYELKSDHNYRFSTKLINEVNTVVGRFLDKYSK